MRLTAPYTLASQTTLQQLFNTPANGAFNALAGTTYLFTCRFDLTAMSATSGTFSFGFLGTATFTNIKYTSLAVKIASIATAGSAVIVTSTVATATPICTANTLGGGHAKIQGIISVNAAGTIIPAVATSIAAPAVVGINSIFIMTPIGSNLDPTTALNS